MKELVELQNGTLEDHNPNQVRLPAIPMLRLRRLQAEAIGAGAAAQAAIDVANKAQQRLQTALTEACEDQGMHLAPDENRPVDIDWMTGVVTLK